MSMEVSKVENVLEQNGRRNILGEMAKLMHAYDYKLRKQESKKKKKKIKQNQKGNISFRDTKDTLNALKQVINPKKVNAVINLLYSTVVKRDPQGKKRTTQQINKLQKPLRKQEPKRTSLKVCNNNIQSLGYFQGKQQFHFDPHSSLSEKVYSNPEEAEKFKQKQMVARCLIKNQYSWYLFKEYYKQIKVQSFINRSRYKIIAYSVATDTYRRIENFLSNQCQIKIKPINHEDVRIMFSLLLNYKKHMNESQNQVMVKFINITYYLSPTTIQVAEAVDLYHAIQQLLKMKLTKKFAEPVYNERRQKLRPHIFKKLENNPIYNIQKIWNDTYEKQLIQTYKTFRQFIKIKQFFVERYPYEEKTWTVKSIRSQFYKIIRIGLKHVARLISSFESKMIPELVKMHETRIRYVMRLTEGENCRLGILNIYHLNTVDPQYLIKLVKMINEFIEAKQRGDYDTYIVPKGKGKGKRKYEEQDEFEEQVQDYQYEEQYEDLNERQNTSELQLNYDIEQNSFFKQFSGTAEQLYYEEYE